MNKVDKILKDAAKITGELYLAYGYVQTPIETLDSTVKASSDFIATIYESIAYLCLRDGKMMEFSGKQYRYDTQKFLLCANGLPLLGRVEHCPFLSVSIEFQSEDILEALKEIGWQSRAGRLL